MVNPWERTTSIVKYPDVQDNYKYGLWIECDDSYYSSIEMDIYYCPICGRKLNES